MVSLAFSGRSFSTKVSSSTCSSLMETSLLLAADESSVTRDESSLRNCSASGVRTGNTGFTDSPSSFVKALRNTLQSSFVIAQCANS